MSLWHASIWINWQVPVIAWVLWGKNMHVGIKILGSARAIWIKTRRQQSRWWRSPFYPRLINRYWVPGQCRRFVTAGTAGWCYLLYNCARDGLNRRFSVPIIMAMVISTRRVIVSVSGPLPWVVHTWEPNGSGTMERTWVCGGPTPRRHNQYLHRFSPGTCDWNLQTAWLPGKPLTEYAFIGNWPSLRSKRINIYLPLVTGSGTRKSLFPGSNKWRKRFAKIWSSQKWNWRIANRNLNFSISSRSESGAVQLESTELLPWKPVVLVAPYPDTRGVSTQVLGHFMCWAREKPFLRFDVNSVLLKQQSGLYELIKLAKNRANLFFALFQVQSRYPNADFCKR